MARNKYLALLMLGLVAGCSSGQSGPAMPVQPESESPQTPGRNCITTIRPDGSPESSVGCTGAEQLQFEQRFYK